MKKKNIKCIFKHGLVMILGVAIITQGLTLTGCQKPSKSNEKTGYQVNSELDTKENVNLIIGGSRLDYKAMEQVARKFTDKYPNCHVEYECIQDFDNTLVNRLTSDDERVDLFVTTNIQQNSPYYSYALNMTPYFDQLGLNGTLPGMIENFSIFGTYGTKNQELYCVPIGGELRGLYVNKTLLNSLNLKVPTNKTELFEACDKLVEAGYVPFQGNPGEFGHLLLWPAIAHTLATAKDAKAVHDMVNNKDPEVIDFLREPLSFAYDIMSKDYYKYKYIETEKGRFVDGDPEIIAKDFLNITGDKKIDDVGEVAFMPNVSWMQSTIDKVKEDYHSNIEYEFILSPVSDEGGYAYLSPSLGLAVNKNTTHQEWALEFMKFFFDEQNITEFAQTDHIIPNISSAIDYTSEKCGVPKEQITQLGQVTFEYSFYDIAKLNLTEIVKGNNPKYMKDDGNGNVSLYDFEYYIDNFKSSLNQPIE